MFTNLQNTFAQSIGDYHYAAMTDVLNYYDSTGAITDNQEDSIVRAYLISVHLGNPPINKDSIRAKYLAGNKSWQDTYGKAVAAGSISILLDSVVTNVGNNLELQMPTDSIKVRQIAENIKTTPNYKKLSKSDINAYAIYEDVLVKSYQLWQNQNNTEKTFKKSKCSCGFVCVICVALQDALGAVVGNVLCGPPCAVLVSTFFSSTARCCICSCCTNVNCGS